LSRENLEEKGSGADWMSNPLIGGSKNKQHGHPRSTFLFNPIHLFSNPPLFFQSSPVGYGRSQDGFFLEETGFEVTNFEETDTVDNYSH
jgi:hypothetical protein